MKNKSTKINHGIAFGSNNKFTQVYVTLDNWKDIEKKLKALEIIKKIILEDLVFDDEKQVIKFSSGFSIVYIKIKDKAEYKLLKEVLK